MNNVIEDIREVLYASGYDTIINGGDNLVVIKYGVTHAIPVENIMTQMEDKIMNMTIFDVASIIIAIHKSKVNQCEDES